MEKEGNELSKHINSYINKSILFTFMYYLNSTLYLSQYMDGSNKPIKKYSMVVMVV